MKDPEEPVNKPRNGDQCDECGGPNPPWLTDAATWHRHVPEDNGNGGEGFAWTVLCPYCFAARVGRDTGREHNADAAVDVTITTLKKILTEVEERRRQRSARARAQAARRPPAQQ